MADQENEKLIIRYTSAQYYITRTKIHFCSCSHFLQSQMLTNEDTEHCMSVVQ